MAEVTEELVGHLDRFAGIALAALIKKAPFVDIKGTLGKEVSQEELMRMKEEIAGAAYEYASYMVIERIKSMKWLKENEESGSMAIK